MLIACPITRYLLQVRQAPIDQPCSNYRTNILPYLVAVHVGEHLGKAEELWDELLKATRTFTQ